MGKTLEEMMNHLPKQRQEKIEAMAAELIAEEMSLRELREDLNLTHENIAQKLGISQESSSRITIIESLSVIQIIQKLRGWLDAGDEKIVPSSGTGNIQKMPLSVVDLFEIGFI